MMIHSVGIVAVVAICTVFIRAIPFLLFGGNRKVPGVIHYLGRVLPPAIMATLVVYCLRGVHITSGNHGLPEIIAVLVVAALHLWKKNILLTVGAGTVCYMLLIQQIFT